MNISHRLPVGVVLPYAGRLAKGDGKPDELAQIAANLWSIGWLYCDGSLVSRDNYPELFGTIGYAFGGDGTQFNLPDLRGQFIRGVSETEKQDPGRKDRTRLPAPEGTTEVMVGTLQTDAFQEHEHHYQAAKAKGPANPEGPDAPYIASATEATTGYVAAPGQAAPRTASETRPVNIYLNYIICFRSSSWIP